MLSKAPQLSTKDRATSGIYEAPMLVEYGFVEQFTNEPSIPGGGIPGGGGTSGGGWAVIP